MTTRAFFRIYLKIAEIDERFGLLDSIEDREEADRRTLADLPLEKAVRMSGTVSSLVR